MPRVFLRVVGPNITMRIELANTRCLSEARAMLMRMSLNGIDSKDVSMAIDVDDHRWCYGSYGKEDPSNWAPLSL